MVSVIKQRKERVGIFFFEKSTDVKTTLNNVCENVCMVFGLATKYHNVYKLFRYYILASCNSKFSQDQPSALH